MRSWLKEVWQALVDAPLCVKLFVPALIFLVLAWVELHEGLIW